jgi:diketogulonate reductase-like aldo/keto reductase
MTLTTRSGKEVFSIGIGTWGIGGTWESEHTLEKEGIEAIRYSVSRGQNHIDCGEVYGAGHTEEIIGEAISPLNREDLFIGDKLWETSVANGLVRPAVMRMLERLKTSYIDVLCVHKPWEDWPWREALPQVNELIDEGLVRYLGASNLNINQIQEAMKLSRHPIVASQLHFNLLSRQDADESMRKFLTDNGIQLIAYKPFERGIVLQQEIVVSVAKKNNATPTQVALAWLIHHGAMPIPQATEKAFIDENIESINLKLSVEDIERLDSAKAV